MKRILFGSALAFTLVIAVAAQEGQQHSHKRKHFRLRHPALHKKLLEKFDADGDGRLNEEERQAVRAAAKERKLEHFDTDGDGALSEAEREAMREAIQERRLEHVDRNGDGEISPRERAAAHRRHDNDNNPPGKKGGPGTNWENPPGKRGGPGASPD